ncbi:hypothetical protein BLA29_009211 [Euroglyphus maynei]|uniref:Uncharacterized protein n=1 Tax=Euroglyphus maynei TaxID=6958 RepID=A0A1Y3B805_EURMA|nr:hypothetical protein BLA29_009211 [Euroglyphus maynei]
MKPIFDNHYFTEQQQSPQMIQQIRNQTSVIVSPGHLNNVDANNDDNVKPTIPMQNAISYMLGEANFDHVQQERIEQSQRDCSLNAALCFAKNNILEYYYKSSNIITQQFINVSHHFYRKYLSKWSN